MLFDITSTLVGHFVLSPRERAKKDTRACRLEEREIEEDEEKQITMHKQIKYEHASFPHLLQEQLCLTHPINQLSFFLL